MSDLSETREIIDEIDKFERLRGLSTEDVNSFGGRQSKISGRYDLLPPGAMQSIAKTMAVGAERYGEHNWALISPVSHINHALRHIFFWLADQGQGGRAFDSEGGEPHLEHALCRLAMAVDLTGEGEA